MTRDGVKLGRDLGFEPEQRLEGQSLELKHVGDAGPTLVFPVQAST